ncbi:ZIP family metal transporter [Palleronia pelagia]|uniref:Zinc transporter, ZIP family n=1 Tax=Palleronia pelagia TaxID=387096 RepID=A0A1H8GA81_9RHOB|nr:hypothetical protein [Palleronia pelagia]SEN40902.1 zinc transporter, ZIP family [Palleronia pelagia]
MWNALVFAALAGLAIPLGGLCALALGRSDTPMAAWGHGVVAFGGGALFSAVALVLVPDGVASLPAVPALVAFVLGGVAFAALDGWMKRRMGNRGQLLAMLTDFIPESVALGALFATGGAGGPLLAMLIALQNLPEAFNAFGEARSGGQSPRRLLTAFAAIACLGPASAAFGMVVLADREALLGALMLFAAGGILYLVFEDVAPGAPAEGSVLPPLGAVGGFALGLAGHMALAGSGG